MKWALAWCVGCPWVRLLGRAALEVRENREAARLHCEFNRHGVVLDDGHTVRFYRIINNTVMFERYGGLSEIEAWR